MIIKEIQKHQKQMRRTVFFFLSLTMLFGLSFRSEARDLHGKFGLGYNAQFSNMDAQNAVPGVSIKYGMTREIGLGLVFGIATSSPSNSVTALKFFKNIFLETNLNFYFLLAGGILSVTPTSSTTSSTAFEFLSGFGAEFFIPGLESLGLIFETGVSFNNAAGSFALKTMGVSFIHGGIHFYF